jgi:hypothetical protein
MHDILFKEYEASIFTWASASIMLNERLKQGKAIPLGFQEVEAPRFLDSRHMKVVSLSALCTGRLYPPGNIPGTHFC